MLMEEKLDELRRGMDAVPGTDDAANRGIAAAQRMVEDWRGTKAWDGKTTVHESLFALSAGFLRAVFVTRTIAMTPGGVIVCTNPEDLVYLLAQQLQVAGLRIEVDADRYDTRAVDAVMDAAFRTAKATQEAADATKQ